MSIFRIPPQDRSQRIRNTKHQAVSLSSEIRTLKAKLSTITDKDERELLRRRIRGMQRAWLGKVRAIAKEEAQ